MVVLLFAGSFLPAVIDLSSFTGVETKSLIGSDDSDDEDEGGSEDKGDVYLFYDESGTFDSGKMFEEVFDGEFTKVDSVKTMKKKIEDSEAKGGFYIKDDLHFEYYVLNSEMDDANSAIFSEIMTNVHKQKYLAEHGFDLEEFTKGYEAQSEGDVIILGKDASENFWYCYALVIAIFMLIILYGVMIATAVTSEKSNRSIEVLVTSIDAKYLLFGKVFAGTLAVVAQVGAIMIAALSGYAINHDAWGNKLDPFLNIPSDVLVGFAVFGIGGFILYAFIYGAVGALVSKTEDINKVAGTVQMIIMIVYFVVLINLSQPDGIIIKVFSFLPISSYSAMFVRIAMGSVSVTELVISAVILYASIILTGWIAAKIYRMGTLRYGNPIKLRNALKLINQKD
jgi:ABC-2 type transport system permease protein